MREGAKLTESERRVTRYPVALVRQKDPRWFEAWSPGFLALPRLDVVRFMLASTAPDSLRILCATVGDRELLPFELPVPARIFSCSGNLPEFCLCAKRRLPEWRSYEWIRVQLDGPCDGVAVLLAPPEE
jgi:hypothetical protein